MPFPGGITQSQANQELIGKKNVTSLALEVPTSCLVGSGNGVIGVWSSASLPQAKLAKPNPTYASPALYGGAYTQVSRLGMPLVNELVIGLPDKDLFNAANRRRTAHWRIMSRTPPSRRFSTRCSLPRSMRPSGPTSRRCTDQLSA